MKLYKTHQLPSTRVHAKHAQEERALEKKCTCKLCCVAVFPYIYIRYRKRTRQGGTSIAPDSSIIRRMAGGVLGIRLYLCLFLSATVQAGCPAGWNTQTGATGLTFDTESTAVSARIRCFSSNDSTRRVWDVVGPSGSCTSGSICQARTLRCKSAAGADAMHVENSMWYCKFCDAGAIRNGVTCNNCGQNQYRVLLNPNVCQSCPVDTVSRPGSTNITDCLQTGCESCGIGTYNEVVGRSVCKQCPAGTFEQRTGQHVCTSCPGGTYSWPRVHVYAMQYFVVQRNANANT